MQRTTVLVVDLTRSGAAIHVVRLDMFFNVDYFRDFLYQKEMLHSLKKASRHYSGDG